MDEINVTYDDYADRVTISVDPLDAVLIRTALASWAGNIDTENCRTARDIRDRIGQALGADDASLACWNSSYENL